MELLPILLICILEILGSFQFHMIKTSRAHFDFIKEVIHNSDEYTGFVDYEENFGIFFTLVFILITDGLRYRSIIILNSIAALVRYLLLFSRPSLFSLQVADALNAFFVSSTAATHVYLYSKIHDKSKYQKITAYVKISRICGIFLSIAWIWNRVYLLQFVNNVEKLPLYITPVMVCIMLICSYILPPVDSKKSNDAEEATEIVSEIKWNTKAIFRINELKTGIVRLWNDFKTAYTNYNVLKWSIWYSSVNFLAPQIYGHTISMLHFMKHVYFVSSSIRFIIIVVILVILCLLKSTNWKTQGDRVLCLVSFILAVLTILLHFHLALHIQYVIAEIITIIAEVFTTIVLGEIVQIIPKNSYALITGVNEFAPHALRSIILFPEKANYFDNLIDFILFYGKWFAVLGIVFGIFAKSVVVKNPSDDLADQEELCVFSEQHNDDQ